ncbi:ABC transporter permease subunit [Marinobacterium rhizophilum]|uniref:ABC transporter permease subunit n=1 Tax=Marinobacterium rhizophilum TaxID=420402 RepID=A0ABY5HF81_9GAMM|nr:ABC transporter permease subunit [Marinobacterium rhizophilum]UTW10233.1 ABC transporter permease subunit [Marinobacterium rhizophilum]
MSQSNVRKTRSWLLFWRGNDSGLAKCKTVTFGDPAAVEGGAAYGVLSVLTVGIVWQLVAMAQIVPPLFWPSPGAVFDKFVQIATEGYKGFTLFEHLGISLYRVLAGFGLGCLFGIPVGLGMGLNKFIKGWMDPLIEFYRPVPPLAYVPLVIIWMGIGDGGKVLLLFLATFSIIVISARAGVASVAIQKIHAAYSLGASRWQVLRHVILVNAMPEIFTGMRVAMGVCWGTLVAAEMVAATSGVGWMVLNASRYLNTDIVLMGVILMGVVGFLIDMCMRKLEQKLIPWKGKGRG